MFLSKMEKNSCLCFTFFPLYISIDLTEFFKQNFSWKYWIHIVCNVCTTVNTVYCGETRNSLPSKFFSSNQFKVRFFSKTLIWRKRVVLNNKVHISGKILLKQNTSFMKVLNEKVISQNFIICRSQNTHISKSFRQFSMIFWTILGSIRTIRNTRTIRVFCHKLFYIWASSIPIRAGNPIHTY